MLFEYIYFVLCVLTFQAGHLFGEFKHPWTELGFCQLSLFCAFYITASCIASLRIFSSAQCFKSSLVSVTFLSNILKDFLPRMSSTFFFLKIFNYIFFHWKTHLFSKLIHLWLTLIFASTVLSSVNLLSWNWHFFFDEQCFFFLKKCCCYWFSASLNVIAHYEYCECWLSVYTFFYITEICVFMITPD